MNNKEGRARDERIGSTDDKDRIRQMEASWRGKPAREGAGSFGELAREGPGSGRRQAGALWGVMQPHKG